MTDKEWKAIFGNVLGVWCLIIATAGAFITICVAGYDTGDPNVDSRLPLLKTGLALSAAIFLLPVVNAGIVKLRRADDKNRHLTRADRKSIRRAESAVERVKAERKLERAVLHEE